MNRYVCFFSYNFSTFLRIFFTLIPSHPFIFPLSNFISIYFICSCLYPLALLWLTHHPRREGKYLSPVQSSRTGSPSTSAHVDRRSLVIRRLRNRDSELCSPGNADSPGECKYHAWPLERRPSLLTIREGKKERESARQNRSLSRARARASSDFSSYSRYYSRFALSVQSCSLALVFPAHIFPLFSAFLFTHPPDFRSPVSSPWLPLFPSVCLTRITAPCPECKE